MNPEPKTLPEWEAYIATLSGADLRSKAIAANQVSFVRLLEADALSPVGIAGVFRAFAVRLQADGQQPPSRGEGTYMDYNLILLPSTLAVEEVA